MKLPSWLPHYALPALAVFAVCPLYLLVQRHAQVKAAQTIADTNSATATQHAAQDALKITVENQAVHGRIDVTTSENTREIHDAAGANQAVDSAVHSTGLRSLCMYAAYRGSDACRQLLQPDPVQPQG